jgi:hypothetical protein
MAETLPKRRSKKRGFLIVLTLVFLVIGFSIFLLYNPSVGFKYYQPSYLPPNVSIMERRISVTGGSTSVEQDFRTVDWVYEIQEYKADSSIGTAQQNYDAKSVEPTCNILTSSANQQYRLCHWIDYGRIDVHQVIFIKDGTYITSEIPTNLQQQISIQEIGKYVDSFKQRATIGLPVLRSSF